MALLVTANGFKPACAMPSQQTNWLIAIWGSWRMSLVCNCNVHTHTKPQNQHQFLPQQSGHAHISFQATRIRILVFLLLILFRRLKWSCAGIGAQASSRSWSWSRNHLPVPQGIAERGMEHFFKLKGPQQMQETSRSIHTEDGTAQPP